MNPAVHFEMPVDDQGRIACFYEAAFGWRTQAPGPQTGHCVVATTTATDATGPAAPGAINGGFFQRKPDWPAQRLDGSGNGGRRSVSI